ncbi:MAG TPA: hypothetical protein PKY29_09695, partial [Ferruginibacter sp.]|nr:hypothetical protein [Ferruginibacter sp.]
FEAMKRVAKILFFTALVTGGTIWASYADRGIGKKKSKVKLNIVNTNNNIKSNLSFNLKTGLKYTGSLLPSTNARGNASNVLVTFQKGNSVYIIPYKQKAISSEIRQGYTGLKLVIKP